MRTNMFMRFSFWWMNRTSAYSFQHAVDARLTITQFSLGTEQNVTRRRYDNTSTKLHLSSIQLLNTMPRTSTQRFAQRSTRRTSTNAPIPTYETWKRRLHSFNLQLMQQRDHQGLFDSQLKQRLPFVRLTNIAIRLVAGTRSSSCHLIITYRTQIESQLRLSEMAAYRRDDTTGAASSRPGTSTQAGGTALDLEGGHEG